MKSVKLKRLMFQYCIAKVIIFAAFLCYKTIHASFKQQNKHKIALKNPSQLRYEQTFEDVDRILTKKIQETTYQIECLQNKKYQLPKQFFVSLNCDIKSILASENAYNFADIISESLSGIPSEFKELNMVIACSTCQLLISITSQLSVIVLHIVFSCDAEISLIFS